MTNLSKKSLYIYTGNFKDTRGILSIINLIKQNFKKRRIIITKKLKKDKSIVLIENFSKSEVNKIINFRKNYKGKVILVVTEFYNKNINSYNCFEQKKIIKFLPLLLIYKIIKSIMFLKIKLKKIFTKKNNKFFSRNFKKNNKKLINNYNKFLFFLKKINEICYFKYRFFNCKKVIKYADIILCTHQNILNDLNFKKKYLLLPIIKNNNLLEKRQNNNQFIFTGHLTKYRIDFFKNLNPNFKNIILRQSFERFKKTLPEDEKFIDIKERNKFFYSLHPKKTKKWKFSSPVRYIESINNNQIPIVFDSLEDIAGKKLTVKFNNLEKKGSKKKLIKSIKEYNKYIRLNNILIDNEINN